MLKKEIHQRKAALQFNISRQTLRDRLTDKIDPECVTTGRAPIFSLEEEEKLRKTMASYGYTGQDVTDIATDYAH